MRFFDNVSPAWLEAQFQLWQEEPALLATEWHAFFSGFELGQVAPAIPGAECPAPELALKQSGVQSLLYRYRDIGHLLACTDPLSPCKTDHSLLALAAFGLDESDLDRTFHTRRFMKESATLGEIVAVMRETYCRSIGVEFMHIQEPAERQWLIDRMESVRNASQFSGEARLKILEKLQEASLFEGYLQRRFPGQTRFSLEGGEVLIPQLDLLVSRAGRLGVTDLILGMPHRGRLNVQAHIFRKPYENIFAEFRDNLELGFVGDGDVKYHGGFSTDVDLAGGGRLHLTLAANPSHLEAIDPVVEGKCRARQDRYGADGAKRVLPLLIHGDAAFAGQGVVAETLNLSQLEGYRSGGTIHIVLNNQIGFTTLPADARTTCYATDLAKMLMIPIFHVHGEDPEAVAHATALAVDYRQTYGRDVVLEVICYRRHGHNEGDEPFFTQPLMYESIKIRPPVHELYAARLVAEGVAEQQVMAQAKAVQARLDSAFAGEPRLVDTGFGGQWHDIQRDYSPVKVATGVGEAQLRSLAETLAGVPAGFSPHPKIAALLQKRQEAVQAGEGIDWGNGEALAFGTLLQEGVTIRLSGQDSRRGTFNQRHSVVFDMASGKPHVPLQGVAGGGAVCNFYDSPLSEAAVLGFDYGYAVESPTVLTIWEAQYGDFVNGAQVVIDQFIVSGETKWNRESGLVMLLPHGYEGQGPEHSSARVERFLQLCSDNNIQVAYPSTPAQYFHLMRRQMLQPFRKPLVVLTPKSLLRHPRCVSRLDEFSAGWFREIIATGAKPEKIQAVLLCSGKIYYELLERQEKEGREEVAIIRIEQLYPLRMDLLRKELARYRKAKRFVWVQEEPANMGAWTFLQPHLTELLGGEPGYVGRQEDASPAVGSHRQHKEEQERLIAAAFA